MQTLNDILSLYAAIKAQSDDMTLLFADADMPENVNYEDLASTIIVQYGTCPVIVSETSQFKWMSDLFFRTWKENFDRVTAAMMEEYNPIENYDRFEDWKDKNKGETKNTGTVKDNGTNNGSISKTGEDSVTATNSGSDTTTNKVSAYNQVGYSDNDQTTVDYGKEDTTKTNYGSTDTNNQTINNTRTDDLTQSEDYNNEHHGRIHGNIGVTTNQQMLQSEIDLRIKTNIYEMIAAKWADTMLLGTW